MKQIIMIVLMLLSSICIGMDLSIENIEGGSEERVTFMKIDEGEFFSFDVVKSIPDDTGAVRIWNAPSGSSFINGIFSWTPDDEQAGMYDVSFSALDPITAEPIFTTIRIAVDNAKFSIRYNKTFEYLFTATDPDDDNVEITVTDLPEGATFTGGQFTPKVFSWTPTKQQLGNHQMTITATDYPQQGVESQQDISVIYIKVTRTPVTKSNAEPHRLLSMNDCSLLALEWLGS